MADDMYAKLTWLASCSSFYSVISVLMCLVVMVVFILRLKVDNVFWSLPATSSPLVARRDMAKLHNPYVLSVAHLESTDLKDGLEINVTCQYPCHITCLWAAGIDDLHHALQQPSATVMVDLDCREFLQDSTILAQNIDIVSPCEKRPVCVSCPVGVGGLGLGQTPRQKYPLVIILSLPLGLADVDISDTHVVMSVYIFHLRDPDCPMKSQLINHYIKLYNGNLLNLQPLFLSACDNSSLPDGESDVETVYRQRQRDANQSEQSEGSEQTDITNTCTMGTKQSDDNSDTGKPTIGADESDLSVSEGVGREEFLMNDFTSETSDDRNVNTEVTGSESGCIVCQASAISTVLLPCRHTCVCDRCFVQLDKCPMCRSFIESYFTLSDSPDDSSHSNRWESLNQQLNSYMGYTQQ